MKSELAIMRLAEVLADCARAAMDRGNLHNALQAARLADHLAWACDQPPFFSESTASDIATFLADYEAAEPGDAKPRLEVPEPVIPPDAVAANDPDAALVADVVRRAVGVLVGRAERDRQIHCSKGFCAVGRISAATAREMGLDVDDELPVCVSIELGQQLPPWERNHAGTTEPGESESSEGRADRGDAGQGLEPDRN